MGGEEIGEVSDINGVPIKVGSTVRYINTGTVGNITDIKQDSEGAWALLDDTDLYYRVDFLEVTAMKKVPKKAEKKKEYQPHRESLEDMESFDSELSSQATGGG
ncbi:Protein of unknown function DUF2098 [Methanosalsum zhilinae DSM 4017]|uniref:DUF2098 domain-containing protein n=1 Tax=Methanosalsum zhilinae (strain DSM 4017 / NBRC 107636 / OCM 62 / WeN5) TaxID=679901 RepID=F7XP05_METZD|nr:DUF2098 domain-containing protein [Methanosalsum zhilinae]AEH60197.1 Protein of unknown function DUF2098 [Methanosalsum zhilinae DSM 4017]